MYFFLSSFCFIFQAPETTPKLVSFLAKISSLRKDGSETPEVGVSGFGGGAATKLVSLQAGPAQFGKQVGEIIIIIIIIAFLAIDFLKKT